MIGLLALLLQTAEVAAPTPRDLYVSCYLYVNQAALSSGNGGREPYNPVTCGLLVLSAIANREGRSVKSSYRFCLPKTAEVNTAPDRAIAFAYIDYFENVASRIPIEDGRAAFVAALIRKWPCPPSP